MVRVTQPDIDISVRGNKDRNRLHLDPDLSRDLLNKMADASSDVLTGDELVAPGALIISKLGRKYPNDEITGFDIPQIKYPVIVPTDGVELEYCVDDVTEDANSKCIDFKIFTPAVGCLHSTSETYNKLHSILIKIANDQKCDAQRLEQLLFDFDQLRCDEINRVIVGEVLARFNEVMAPQAQLNREDIDSILDKVLPLAMAGKIYLHKTGDVNIPSTFFDTKNKFLGDKLDKVSEESVLLNASFGPIAGTYKINQEFPDKFPYKFRVTNETLRLFCWSSGMPERAYLARFGRNISPMMGAYLLVDPLLEYADCIRQKSETLARASLGVDDSVPLSRLQLYLGASMCSTDQVKVPVNGSDIPIYLCPGNGLRFRKTPNSKETSCLSLFYLMMIDPKSRQPFIAGTFKTMEKYAVLDKQGQV